MAAVMIGALSCASTRVFDARALPPCYGGEEIDAAFADLYART